MSKDSGWGATPAVTPQNANEQGKPQPKVVYSDENVKDWLDKHSYNDAKFCCLLYGTDGVGKSGICLDYLTPEDIEEGKKLVIIDLDGGNVPLISAYHRDKLKNISCINPLVTTETEEGTIIDYKKTFAKIRAIIRYVKQHHKRDKIKAIVFDGLSTALRYAENQMRLDKNLDTDGGVQTRYWLLRNKLFIETLEQLKSIPIDRFFIAHEDFIVPKVKADLEKFAKVKGKTNQMMFQKILCNRSDEPDIVRFTATIDKSKYTSNAEGKKMEFCTVNKQNGEVKWNTAAIFECLV